MLGDVLAAKGEPEAALTAYEEARRDVEGSPSASRTTPSGNAISP